MKTEQFVPALALPVTKTIQFQPVYLVVEAGVRYWEDATVNGIVDKDGTLIPRKAGKKWTPTIELSTGLIIHWPTGTTADIHYKVCDQGEYWLLDDDKKRVSKWAGFYVPNDFLCHGDTGYGDYIIFKVGTDGVIKGWRTPEIQPANRDGDESGWKNLSESTE